MLIIATSGLTSEASPSRSPYRVALLLSYAYVYVFPPRKAAAKVPKSTGPPWAAVAVTVTRGGDEGR